MLHGLLLFTLTLTLLLRLLLGTSALIQRIEINLTQHVHLRRHLFLALQREDILILSRGFLYLRLVLHLGLRLFSLRGNLYLRLGLWFLLGFWSRLWFGFGLRLRLHLNGFWLGGLYRLLHLGFFFLFGSRLTYLSQIDLTQRRECLSRLFLHHFYYGLRLCLGFILLLREDHPGLGLHVLVTLELLDQCVVLLIRDLGVDIGVILDVTQTLLVLQIVDSCLKTNIEFC